MDMDPTLSRHEIGMPDASAIIIRDRQLLILSIVIILGSN